ncbi:MAG: hypothetical protein JRN20_00180 [Nitrososphaerota archaeon]|nr:hypothetical protein [Nitrososphaerota archaeon]MDG6923468.1 hypothetical protein [Nitrososphaerota archaeon]
MLFPQLDLDILFDIMSGIVALLVSYYSFRYTRLIENSVLKFISLGFIMLGIGLLVEACVFSLVVFNVGDLTTVRIFALGTAALYYILQMGAYFLFAVGYLRSALAGSKVKIEAAGTVAAGFLLPIINSPGGNRVRAMFHLTRTIFVVTEIFSVVFLAVVVFVGLLSYSETRHRFSLLVLASFVLILAAQAFELWTAISISVRLDFVSSAVQFAGFLSLLIFLLWRNKIGPARKTAQ